MTFSAVLLVGGESRRMGRDKAMLVFHARPLWERQIALLRKLQPQEIFVSARTEPVWLPHDAQLLLDEPPSRGPLSGLTTALNRMQTSHLIALAVDMPWMTSARIRVLCGRATIGCGVVPIIGDLAEPLAAIYPREVAIDFLIALRGGDFSMQTLVRVLAQTEKVRMIAVSEEEQCQFRSMNEPGDFDVTDAGA